MTEPQPHQPLEQLTCLRPDTIGTEMMIDSNKARGEMSNTGSLSLCLLGEGM